MRKSKKKKNNKPNKTKKTPQDMINHLAKFDKKQLCSSTVYNWGEQEQENIPSEDPELIFITLDRHFAF